MGCICSKPSADEYSKHESSRKQLSQLKISRVGSSKMNKKIWEKDGLDCGDVTVMLFDKKANASLRSHGEANALRKKTEIPEVSIFNHPCMGGKIPKVTEAEQVAAGWPSWLATAAGEAIKGWLPKRANNFVKLDKIGQGTYSSVYKARDVIQNKVVALKRVRFDNQDTESIKFMAREILVLRRLDHPNIVKLEGLITSQASCSLYLVFEYMEHDLTGLTSRPGSKFTEPQVKCYMKQLLSGLHHCHSHGVLHRDIKGSNLLIDNNGNLKIADFGLAVFFDPQLTVPMTSRVVTLWYRPPELLLGASQYGAAVDLWSTGCILGELYASKPILPGKTEVEQLHMIFKLCGSPSKDYWSKLHLKHSSAMKPPQSYGRCLNERFKDLPSTAVELMDTLLSIDPAERGTAASALNSQFFTASPLPCDPSSLPKYPPSKEIDSKMRNEEARRHWQAGPGGRSRTIFPEVKRLKQSRVVPATKANAELVISLLRKQNHSSSQYRTKAFHCHQGDTTSFSIVDPVNEIQVPKYESRSSKRTSNSGPLNHGLGLAKSRKELKHVPMVSSNYLTSSVSMEFETCKDLQERNGVSKPESISEDKNLPVSSAAVESMKKRSPDSCELEDSKACTKEPAVVHRRDSNGNQIYISGSFLISSHNMDRILKKHDHRIQDYAQRSRLEKINVVKV